MTPAEMAAFKDKITANNDKARKNIQQLKK